MEAAASSCRRPRTQNRPVPRRRRRPLRRRSATIDVFQNFQKNIFVDIFLFWESFQTTTARLEVSFWAGRDTFNCIYKTNFYTCRPTVTNYYLMENHFFASKLYNNSVNYFSFTSACSITVFIHQRGPIVGQNSKTLSNLYLNLFLVSDDR